MHAAGVSGAGPGLMRVCIEFLLDLAKEREQEMVVPLLVALVQQGAVSKADLIAALQRFSRQLEDLRCFKDNPLQAESALLVAWSKG